MKVCTKCGQCKPLEDFHNCASKPSGKMSACKTCRNSYNKTKAEEIGHDVLYRRAKSKDAEKYAAQRKKYYRDNADRIKQKSSEWKRNNADRAKELRKMHYEANRERYIVQALAWAKDNQESRRLTIARHSKKIRSDPRAKPLLIARKLMSRMLGLKLATKGKRTFEQLGYNKEQFMKHIEKRFEDGMCWENHGEWHLDHIISVKECIQIGVHDPKIINALSNLRPIWAKDNLSKGCGFALVAQFQQ